MSKASRIAPGQPDVEYDPQLIYQFAEHLYRIADQTIFLHTVVGIILGFVVGLQFGALTQNTLAGGVIMLLCGGIVGLLGRVIGNQRAFRFKFEAQMALCHAQIEVNTRAYQRTS